MKRALSLSSILLSIAALGCKGPSPGDDPARAASTAAPAPHPSLSAAPPASSTPPLPATPSASAPGPDAFAPSLEPEAREWAGAPEIAVRGARALGCEARLLREWLRVRCEARAGRTPTEIVVDKGRRKATRGLGESLRAERGAMVLIQAIRPGADFAATFFWKEEERVLTARWPAGAAESARIIAFDSVAPEPRAGASAAPAGADEWAGAAPVNVPGAAALGCEGHLRRETLRVRCRAEVEIEVTRESHRTRSRLARDGLIVELAPGAQLEARFTFADTRVARLVVWWPAGEMMPDPVGRFVMVL